VSYAAIERGNPWGKSGSLLFIEKSFVGHRAIPFAVRVKAVRDAWTPDEIMEFRMIPAVNGTLKAVAPEKVHISV
jgi:hypothetical protein